MSEPREATGTPSEGAGSLPAEEAARASMYGLLAAWWLAPPTRWQIDAMLEASSEVDPSAPTDDIDAAWQSLIAAARNADEASLAAEHAALFDGVGRAEVLPFASHALTGALHGEPLIELRAQLRALGIAPDPRVPVEDHIAFELAVMQWLIAGDDPRVCNLAHQQQFYARHLQTWVVPFCDGVIAHPVAEVWRHVAELTRAFMRVETMAFDLLES